MLKHKYEELEFWGKYIFHILLLSLFDFIALYVSLPQKIK